MGRFGWLAVAQPRATAVVMPIAIGPDLDHIREAVGYAVSGATRGNGKIGVWAVNDDGTRWVTTVENVNYWILKTVVAHAGFLGESLDQRRIARAYTELFEAFQGDIAEQLSAQPHPDCGAGRGSAAEGEGEA